MEGGLAERESVFQTADEAFRKKQILWAARWLILSTIVIFCLETLLMVVLELLLDLPQSLILVLDGLVLVLGLLPLNYAFVVRPLIRQVEEHRRTNQELVKTNEILERFFSISDVLIAYLDSNFNFLRVNQAYANADQRALADFIGKNHFDLFPNAENQAIFESVVRTGTSYVAYEKPFEYAGHPERGISYWDWSLQPVKDPAGQVVALILALTDVTARKQAQLALAESERRFRAVFNQTFQHSALLDSRGRIRVANQTMLDFIGLAQAEVEDRLLWQVPWWDSTPFSPTEGEGGIQAAVEQAAGGTVTRSEHRVRSVTGETAIMDITIKPLLDEIGNTVLLIFEARDITEHSRAEEALKRREATIQNLYLVERRARQFAETLRRAILSLSGSLNSETVLEKLLDHLFEVVPYTSAHILMLEDEDHLVVRLARGEESWTAEECLSGRLFDFGDLAFFEPLLKERLTLSVPDTLLYPGAIFPPTDPNVLSWLGLPLEAGDQVIGICLLEHRCPGFFTDDLVAWATALAGQAAAAIHNAWLFEQVRDGREHLQALSRQLVEAQERERYFIARELHDEAGQALASIKFGLHHLELISGDQQKVVAHIHELKQIADGVMDELHRLSVNLRPAALDHLGLVAALRQHVEAVSGQHGLPIRLDIIGQVERLPDEMETAIYRIVQETLTNIIRHAQASRVDILLERRDQRLCLSVEDDGVGFDPHFSQTSHLGILGIRERADMLGGKVAIESSPGKGTMILLEVPWPSGS